MRLRPFNINIEFCPSGEAENDSNLITAIQFAERYIFGEYAVSAIGTLAKVRKYTGKPIACAGANIEACVSSLANFGGMNRQDIIIPVFYQTFLHTGNLVLSSNRSLRITEQDAAKLEYLLNLFQERSTSPSLSQVS